MELGRVLYCEVVLRDLSPLYFGRFDLFVLHRLLANNSVDCCLDYPRCQLMSLLALGTNARETIILAIEVSVFRLDFFEVHREIRLTITSLHTYSV